MSADSQKRAEEFLKISHQFQLGLLTTEQSHPVTANLSQTAKADIKQALKLLFEVDKEVLQKYREFAASGRPQEIKSAVLTALRKGGRIFFSGCGSTGRLSIQLDSIWRDFWQRQKARSLNCSPSPTEFENRTFSVMAGGDYALIKSVEGFEDYTQFGRKQMADLGISRQDVLFAITEGGETSFVIGTAWEGVKAGAKVYFVYNNPDEVLCRSVLRSREIIEDQRIEKINLTTGPMAITGSTRMQATTIQLCVMLTILEMVLCQLMQEREPGGDQALEPGAVPREFLHQLTEMQHTLMSDEVLDGLTQLVALEEMTYRSGHKINYLAHRFGIDALTDTTERSPTYCTPPFRKFDDIKANDSWAFLFVPEPETERAWQKIIKRAPRCIEWTQAETKELVGQENTERICGIIRKIGYSELMRFRVGLDGVQHRALGKGDAAVGIISGEETDSLISSRGFYRTQLQAAHEAGSQAGLICLGALDSLKEINNFIAGSAPDWLAVLVAAPKGDLLLDGATRVGLKILLNALSTCTMVRLGRVMGNYMIWVVPSNLKLIDRATRYIQKLSGLNYTTANQLLFEVMEYVEPRMKADQAYPPVVAVSVLRSKYGIGNEEAEKRLMAEQR